MVRQTSKADLYSSEGTNGRSRSSVLASKPSENCETFDTNESRGAYVSPGMPELNHGGNTVSFFEFWPTWLIYLPVVLQWLLLSVRYRSLTLPLIANPSLPLSGMVGVAKSLILSQSPSACEGSVLPWFVYHKGQLALGLELDELIRQIKSHGFSLPLVCKPDIGCRGVGVKLVKDYAQLEPCLAAYPVGAGMMIQKLASYEPEAGVFFIREPGQAEGEIVSLALKYSPYVVGNGSSTLEQLIELDPRAGKVKHLYLKRHCASLTRVLEKGEAFKLVFSASHCRGAIFRDARAYISPALNSKMNELLADLTEFHYGRLDIKFPDMDALARGEGIEIVEINTASSESLHIWDKDATLREAVSSLLFQYKTLFSFGRKNLSRGYKPPGILKLLTHWKKERRLSASYPETD